MKKKFRLIYLTMIILLLGVVHISYAQTPPGYYNLQPRNTTVLVSKPMLSMQLILNGNQLNGIDMKLDGKKVNARYNTSKQAIVYQPPSPLKAGRHKVTISVSIKGFKPIVQSSEFTISANAQSKLLDPLEEDKKALVYSNRYRNLLRLKPLTLDKSLSAAAKAHAQYMDRNKKVMDNEFASNKGFTGINASKRAMAFGYVGNLISENISFGSKSAQEAIKDLIDAPYHRLRWINPFFTHLGVGYVDKYYTFTFGGNESSADQLIMYPKDYQKDVPVSWDANETPSPLRIHGSKKTVGYPITLSYFSKSNIKSFNVQKAVLTSNKGHQVPVLINTPKNDQELENSVVIIPSNPLNSNEVYTVWVKAHVTLENGVSKNIDKKWTFTTSKSTKDQNGWMKQSLFRDIKNHWAKDEILDLGQKGIITEKYKQLYKPDDAITRGEFTEFVVNALGIRTKPYEGIFKDVNKNTKQALYIEAAYREGMVQGLGNGTFQPNRTITREEIASLIMRAYEKKGKNDYHKLLPLSFKDKRSISDWARNDVQSAYTLKIMRGREYQIFEPKSLATRAEGAVMVGKLLDILTKEKNG